ncbi:MAG: acyltransferase family protein [Actinomycetota bacterium]
MNVFIRQLTGIRLVAAAWVLLYHLQGPLAVIGVLSLPVLPEVLRVGRLGVDLFFALSGFILAHTYLTRLGPALRARGTLHFWWLRLARIYPVHLVMLLVAGVAVVAQARVSGEALDRDWLTPWDFIKNLLLIQEWGSDPQRGWNFVAWSLSMEWLAYLLFPLLVLVLFWMHRRLPTWLLVVAWIVVMAPLVGYGLSTSDAYYTDNWGSTYRVLTEFTAGALTYLIVRRFFDGESPSASTVRIANIASYVLPLLVIAGAVFLGTWGPAQPGGPVIDGDREPLPPYFHLTLVPLLILWIGALAVAQGGVARALATRIAILGGFVSYSLYMTHLVVFGLWRAGLRAFGIESGLLYALSVIALVAGCFLVAYAMWRWIEEPARKWMRGLVGTRREPTEEAGEAEILESGARGPILPVDVPESDQKRAD